MRIYYLPVLLLLLISFHSFSQNDAVYSKADLINPFDSIQYDSVVAYTFNYDTIHHTTVFRNDFNITNEKGQLAGSAIRPGKRLTKGQIDTFITLVTDTSTYGGNHAECFDPVAGFVFYKKGSPTASVSVSMNCNSLISDPVIPAEFYFHKTYKVNGQGTDTDYQFGLSASGRAAIKAFCHELKLYDSGGGASIFDTTK